MAEWVLYVCGVCGDHALAAEEVVHLPNQRCAGRREPKHVRAVVVEPKRERPAKTLSDLMFLDRA